MLDKMTESKLRGLRGQLLRLKALHEHVKSVHDHYTQTGTLFLQQPAESEREAAEAREIRDDLFTIENLQFLFLCLDQLKAGAKALDCSYCGAEMVQSGNDEKTFADGEDYGSITTSRLFVCRRCGQEIVSGEQIETVKEGGTVIEVARRNETRLQKPGKPYLTENKN